MVGADWTEWEKERPKIQNVWSRFHGFSEAQFVPQQAAPPGAGFNAWVVTPFALEAAKEELRRAEERLRDGGWNPFDTVRLQSEQLIALRTLETLQAKIQGHEEEWKRAWDSLLSRSKDEMSRLVPLLIDLTADFNGINTVFSGYGLDSVNFESRTMEEVMRDFDRIGPGDPYVEEMTKGYKERLWKLATDERNPGPYLHYLQDVHCHAMYSNVRGHPLAGHVPDFLSHNMKAAEELILETLQALCAFHAFLYNDYQMPASSRQPPTIDEFQGFPAWWRAETSEYETKPEICGKSRIDSRILFLLNHVLKAYADVNPAATALTGVAGFLEEKIYKKAEEKMQGLGLMESEYSAQFLNDASQGLPNFYKAVDFFNSQIENQNLVRDEAAFRPDPDGQPRISISEIYAGIGMVSRAPLPVSRDEDPYLIWNALGAENPLADPARGYRLKTQALRFDFDIEGSVSSSAEDAENPYAVEVIDVRLDEEIEYEVEPTDEGAVLKIMLPYTVSGMKKVFSEQSEAPSITAKGVWSLGLDYFTWTWSNMNDTVGIDFGPPHITAVEACHIRPFMIQIQGGDERLYFPCNLYTCERGSRRELFNVGKIYDNNKYYSEFNMNLKDILGDMQLLPDLFDVECVVHLHGLKPRTRIFEIKLPKGTATTAFSSGARNP